MRRRAVGRCCSADPSPLRARDGQDEDDGTVRDAEARLAETACTPSRVLDIAADTGCNVSPAYFEHVEAAQGMGIGERKGREPSWLTKEARRAMQENRQGRSQIPRNGQTLTEAIAGGAAVGTGRADDGAPCRPPLARRLQYSPPALRLNLENPLEPSVGYSVLRLCCSARHRTTWNA